MTRKSNLLACLGIVVGLLLPPATTHADELVPGISVSPALLTIQVDNNPNPSATFSVRNDYPVAVTFAAELKGIDEKGDRLLPTGPVESGLASSLRLSQTSFTVPPHSSAPLSVQLSSTQNISPGGHYASVVLTQQQAGSQQLGLQASISLSLFILKQTGAITTLKADSLDTNGWLFHLPSQVSVHFTNLGNIHVVPRALINIFHGNTTLASGIANQASLPLLPGNSATSVASITTKLRNDYVPGRVQIAATYRADGSDMVQTIQKTMWYIPPFYPLVIVVFAAGVVLFAKRRKRSTPTHEQADLNTAIVLGEEDGLPIVLEPVTVTTTADVEQPQKIAVAKSIPVTSHDTAVESIPAASKKKATPKPKAKPKKKATNSGSKKRTATPKKARAKTPKKASKTPPAA